MKKADSDAKLKAIEKLLKHGNRGDEWKEAGLLYAIEKVIEGADISSDGIAKLIKEAGRF